MSLYFVGIDISKYKHDCCIISAASQNVLSKFTIKNDRDGFEQLLITLHSLSTPECLKIGFESTAHSWMLIQFLSRNTRSLQLLGVQKPTLLTVNQSHIG